MEGKHKAQCRHRANSTTLTQHFLLYNVPEDLSPKAENYTGAGCSVQQYLYPDEPKCLTQDWLNNLGEHITLVQEGVKMEDNLDGEGGKSQEC
jgi:hypothetical protein